MERAFVHTFCKHKSPFLFMALYLIWWGYKAITSL